MIGRNLCKCCLCQNFWQYSDSKSLLFWRVAWVDYWLRDYWDYNWFNFCL